MGVRSLSIHRDYACRHAGACCTSAWTIPVEPDRLARMSAALATAQLRTVEDARGTDPFVPADDQRPDAPALISVVNHACVFYDRGAHAHCRVHASLGHDALPLACRQFPRVTLRDPGGVSITLSHYCPTAAALLLRDEPVSIVDAPAAFPSTGEYVGLEASDALPPLLRSGMLMDWPSWWRIEALAVDLLANSPYSGIDAVAALGDAVDRLEGWHPADGPLIDRVRTSFADARPRPRPPGVSPDDIIAAIPEDLRSTRPAPSGATVPDRVLKRFLAAHAFANWAIHLGPGLRAWYRSIEAAQCLIGAGHDVRQADLVLRHLAEPNYLANFV